MIGCLHAENTAALIEFFVPIAVSQESVIADALEPVRQYVEQKPPNEFIGGQDYRLPVLTIPGVVAIVAIGKAFVPVEEHEIAALRAVVSAGLVAKVWPFLQLGQRVRLIDGPLRGTEGFVQHIKGECRLILSVSLLQRCISVEIDRSSIQPV